LQGNSVSVAIDPLSGERRKKEAKNGSSKTVKQKKEALRDYVEKIHKQIVYERVC